MKLKCDTQRDKCTARSTFLLSMTPYIALFNWFFLCLYLHF